MAGEVGEQGVVRLPAVGELGTDAKVDGLVGGMGIEEVGYPGASDDDAGVAVAGCEDTQAAGFQVERGGVDPARQRMQDDRHVELAALQPVGGVDPGSSGRRAGRPAPAPGGSGPLDRDARSRSRCLVG